MNWLVVLTALFGLALSENNQGVLVGQIRTRQHGVKGKLYALDEKTLLVKNFEYDGAGPDAFFYVGKEGSEPDESGTILPYPFEGRFFEYEDSSAPILKGRFDGSKDIKLTLPDKLKVTDLKWFSVWCRAFKVDFGDVMFPENFSLQEKTDGELPPPLLPPSTNAHDPNRHDDDDVKAEAEPEGTHETDAKSEAEPEGEAESNDIDHKKHQHHQKPQQTPRKSGSSRIASTLYPIFLFFFVAKFLL